MKNGDHLGGSLSTSSDPSKTVSWNGSPLKSTESIVSVRTGLVKAVTTDPMSSIPPPRATTIAGSVAKQHLDKIFQRCSTPHAPRPVPGAAPPSSRANLAGSMGHSCLTGTTLASDDPTSDGIWTVRCSGRRRRPLSLSPIHPTPTLPLNNRFAILEDTGDSPCPTIPPRHGERLPDPPLSEAAAQPPHLLRRLEPVVAAGNGAAVVAGPAVDACSAAGAPGSAAGADAAGSAGLAAAPGRPVGGGGATPSAAGAGIKMLIIGSSMVRYVSVPGALTHSISGGTVNDVHCSLLRLLRASPHLTSVAVHVGANDIKFRDAERLKDDFRSLIRSIRAIKNPPLQPIISGPFISPRYNSEQSSRMQDLHVWLRGYCCNPSIPYVDNFALFTDRRSAFAWDGRLGGDNLHLNLAGAGLLSRAIALTAKSHALTRGKIDNVPD